MSQLDPSTSPDTAAPPTLPGDPMPPPDPEAPGTAPPRGGWPTAVAWAAFLIAALGMATLQTAGPAEPDPTAEDEVGNRLLELQGKYAVGAVQSLGATQPTLPDQLVQSMAAQNTGTIGQRLRFAILVGELQGPDAAVEHLQRLDELIELKGVEEDDEGREERTAIERLYAARAAGDSTAEPDAEESARLRERLGWFGRLLLAPDGSSDEDERDAVTRAGTRVLVAAVGGIGTAVAAGVAGVIGLIVVIVLLATGALRGGIRRASGPTGVYAETFALWLVGFVLLSSVLSILLAGVHPLAGAVSAFFLSLLVLGWPVLRGRRWSLVCADIGWTRGRGVLVEGLLGIAAYAMTIPLLALGLVLMFVLAGLTSGGGDLFGGGEEDFGGGGGPAHPIVALAGAGVFNTVMLYLVAAVAAPIVEETMFRGVLYRHVRGLTRRIGIPLSAVVSGVGTGLVFAIIHPQGLIAVPVLTMLALGFALAREWRDTIIPAVVAHAINNAAVMTLMTLAFSGS